MNLNDATKEQRRIIEVGSWFADQHKCLMVILPSNADGAVAVGELTPGSNGVERLMSLLTVSIGIVSQFVNAAYPDDESRGKAMAIILGAALERSGELSAMMVQRPT